ncbi:IQ domain-containing protein C isoform X2 [Stegostoma tigrinum]|uniref:IQ domain-containing protein C isoform X2 n=1 Tax=Stegostoma tigrinum TaxID=3053191 RepID=UPI0028702090|nr:IQ domain-containing protein C isoform X2 [Stegostoma tigrinum]
MRSPPALSKMAVGEKSDGLCLLQFGVCPGYSAADLIKTIVQTRTKELKYKAEACVRGYLVRKSFQRLRQDYENIVKEIEGDVLLLEWDGKVLPRPKFKEQNARRKGMSSVIERTACETLCPEGEKGGICGQFEGNEPEKDDCEIGISSIKGNFPALAEHLDVPGILTGAPTTWGQASNKIEGVIQPLEMEKASPASGDERKESDTTLNFTDVTSVWNSTVLEDSTIVLSTESLCKLQKKEMPTTLEGIQKYRSSLAMELLWLQQAIASRKNYLILKQRLRTPE